MARPQKNEGRSNQQKRNSPTVVPEHDPEAVNQPQKRGGYAPSYKPSIVVTKDRVITGQTVHPSNEAMQVPDLLDQSERVTGQKPEIVMADAGYNVGSVLHEAVARELNFLCPQGRAHDSEGDWAPDSKRTHKSQFKYHEKTDSYVCPQGRVLARVRHTQGFVQYRSVSCERCPLRAQCIKDGERRSVKRAPEDEIREALHRVMQQPGARRQYKRTRQNPAWYWPRKLSRLANSPTRTSRYSTASHAFGPRQDAISRSCSIQAQRRTVRRCQGDECDRQVQQVNMLGTPFVLAINPPFWVTAHSYVIGFGG